MKILLMGDASNFHCTLAQGLRLNGHDVTVASNGSRWMDTSRDINLYRSPGKMGGALLWARLNTTLRPRLKGYDIVAITNTGFIEQRPPRQMSMLRRLKRDNGRLFLTMLGPDTSYIDACLADNPSLRYSERRAGGKPTPYAIESREEDRQWRSPEVRAFNDLMYSLSDGIATILPEYDITTRAMHPGLNIRYCGFPINIDEVKPRPLNIDGPVNIFQCCHRGRENEKGAWEMRRVIERLVADNPGRVNYNWVQNVPYAQFVKLLGEAHIVVDQLYSYAPATTALLAMAEGKVAVSGAEPEYYQYLGNPAERPVINAVPGKPELLYNDLSRLVNDPSLLQKMASESRLLVENHHNYRTIAQQFLDFWTS